MIAHERTVEPRSPPSWAPTRWPTCRWPGSTRPWAPSASATATPASRATTRWPAATRRAGSSRSSCRSCAPRAVFAPPLRRHRADRRRHARCPPGPPLWSDARHGRRPHRTAIALRLRGLPPRTGRGRAGARPGPARRATCSSSCPRARASRCATSCRRSCATTSRWWSRRSCRSCRTRSRRSSASPRAAPPLINAQQDAGANRAAMARAAAGEVRLLYIAPERFSSPGFAEALRAAHVGLFVVDEAHCVSQWGHDFRPDYFRLADAARWLGAQALVASTATATPQVAADIVARLGLREPGARHHRLRSPEPVLRRRAVPRRGRQARADRRRAGRTTARARPSSTPGTRAETEDLAGALEGALGTEVLAYHAGLGRQERADAQRRFMDGEVEVVVATNAFGMGVDKADVRTVAHATRAGLGRGLLPGGRARGPRRAALARAALRREPRQGPARVLHPARRGRRRGARGGGRARCCAPRSTAATTCRCRPPAIPSPSACAPSSAISRGRAWCARRPAPIDRLRGRVLGAFDGRARATCRSSAGDAQRARWRQYRAVWAFVEGAECRRAAILRHFGDRAQPQRRGAVLRRLRARARPCGAGAASRAPAGRRPATSTRPSSTSSPAPSRRSGARGRSRSCAAGARRSCARTPTTGCPPTGRSSHLRADEVLARVDELLDEGRLVSTGGAYPKLRVGAGRAQ